MRERKVRREGEVKGEVKEREKVGGEREEGEREGGKDRGKGGQKRTS